MTSRIRWKLLIPAAVCICAAQAWASSGQRSLQYDIEFRGKKSGFVKQSESVRTNGDVHVAGTSSSLFKILFYKIKTKVKYSSIYRNKRLFSFTFDRTLRGKRLQLQVTQKKKGYHVVHISAGKRKEKFFAYSAFQGTSRDYRVPVKAVGTKLKRKVLNFAQLKIAPQELHYVKAVKRRYMGRTLDLLEVTARGKKGSATLYITKKGLLVHSIAKIRMVGSVALKLAQAKGHAF